jgi:hypothetical protein
MKYRLKKTGEVYHNYKSLEDEWLSQTVVDGELRLVPPLDDSMYDLLHEVEIRQSEYPWNPREDNEGNITMIVCWHRNYNLGDVRITDNDDLEQYEESYGKEIQEAKKWGLFSKVYIYDHSGIDLSLGDFGNWPDILWDAGQVGFMYVNVKKALNAFGRKRMTKKFAKKLEKVLQEEFDVWRNYCIGDTYEVLDVDSKEVVFDGTYDECDSWVEEHDDEYYLIPDLE